MHDQKVQDVLAGISRFYECLDADWTEAVQGDAIDSLTRAMDAYQDVSCMALDAEKQLWCEVPKHHFVQHLIEQCTYGNPKHWWCYSDEDFMGIMKKIVLKSCVATSAPFVVKKAVERWEKGMAYRLQLEENKARG